MPHKSFVLSVKVVIFNEAGGCLVLKRSKTSKGNPGKWDLPGGKAELGEKFDEALLREVREETGLTIQITRVAGAAEFELANRRIAYIIMAGQLENGTVELSDEHDEFAWVSRRELSSIDLAEQFTEFGRSFANAAD